jgi:hypothetical protein
MNPHSQPIYSPHSRVISASRKPIKLVESYRCVVDGISVGFPSKFVATGPTLEAAQSAMIRKIKAAHIAASAELYKYKTRCALFESATGLSLENDFSDYLSRVVMDDVRREILVFIQAARRAGKPFPQSPENAETLFAAFQARHGVDPSFVFSSDNLFELYQILLRDGAISIEGNI